MKKQITVSVGIPAYNEQANIKKLLTAILAQRQVGYLLNEIILVSDGSTDATASLAEDMDEKRIKILRNSKRVGKSYSLSQIMERFTGDVLIMLDADIKIKDHMLFSKVINTHDLSKSGVIGINATPLRPTNVFQKIIYAGVKATKELAKNWNNGKNYLNFKGCFLALDRKLAKSLSIHPTLINNDAYFYFAALTYKYSPLYCDDAKVFYKLPMNVSDHLKQAMRFKGSYVEMQERFKGIDLRSEYVIPFGVYITMIIRNLILNPFYFIPYLFLKTYSILKTSSTPNHIWSIAVSTKN